MKTIPTLLLLLGLTAPLSAQVYVGDTDINQLDYVEYLHIDFHGDWTTPFVVIADYGQPPCTNRQRALCRLCDEHGNERRFFSKMEVFNFLDAQGWEHRETYQTMYLDHLDDVHLFRRKPSSGDH